MLNLEIPTGHLNLSGFSFTASRLCISLKKAFLIPVLLENDHIFSSNTLFLYLTF